MSAIHAHQAPGSRSARRSSSRRAGCKIARAVNLVIEQLESRVLLSGTLPAAVHASTDAVYSVTGDSTSGYAVTLSAGTYSFDANEGAPGGDWQNLSLTLTGTADVSFNAPQTFTAFTLSATAKAAVSSSGGGISGNLLDIAAGGFSMPLDPVSGNPTATLDLMDNDMILRGAASGSWDDELPVLRNLLHSGRAGGPGLRSSDTTESGTSYVTRLGYRDGLSSFDGQSSINGQAVKAADTLVKYTLNGDMDLDGRVTNADFARFSNSFGLSGTATWQTGDFNYDGNTNNGDFALLSNDFGQNITGPNFARTLLPVGLAVTATEGQPLTGVELATFTDTHNATSQVTQATDYTASVSWGDGVFSPTNVTVTADTDPADPNGFVVTASSTGPITNPDELIATQIQYASTSSYHGRPASLGEPVVSITPAVAGLYAVPVSVSQMNLYWTLNASNATSIEVARSDDGGAYATLAATAGGSATMFTDTTVSEGHTYSYEIRAVQPIGDSAYSDPATATTFAVQGLVATAASTTEIDLSWLNLSTDPNATVDVQRAPYDLSAPFANIAMGLAANSTNYQDATGLMDGTHYVYKVVIHDAFGDTFAGPADTWTLPAAPIGLTVTSITSGEVDLRWANGPGGLSGFLIERSSDGTNYYPIGQVDPGVNTYVDRSVADGTSYEYQIIAINAGGTSSASDTLPISTPLAAPTALTAVTASGPSDEVDLSWSNGSQVATGFIVERSIGGGPFNQIASLSANNDTYLDTAVQFGAQYTYRVRAAGSGSPSIPSTTASATTLPAVSISADSSVTEYNPYILTPSVSYGSSSPPFPVTGWSINWGDGVTESLAGTGPFTHSYKEPGLYSVAATAQTTNGGVNSLTQVSVFDAPVALLLSSYAFYPASGSFTLPLTLDNPGNESITNWIIDWGDGTVVRTADPGAPTLNHFYAHGGGYSVNVTAFTDEGAYNAFAHVNVPPNSFPPEQPGPRIELYAVRQDGGTEGENDASVPLYTTCPSSSGSPGAAYTLDWGDGSAPQSGTLDAYGDALPTHAYPEQGLYWVTATAGGSTDHAQVSVADGDSAPSLSPIPDQTVAAGDPVDVSVAVTGLDSDGPSAAYMDWGDGHGPQRATLTAGGDAGTVTAHLDHAPPGSSIATLSVYDENFHWSSLSFKYDGTLAPTVQVQRTGLKFGQTVSADDQHSGDPNNFVILTDNGFGVDPEGLQQNDQLLTAPIVNGQLQTGTDGQPVDTDLSQLTLSKLPDGLTSGTVSIDVSLPANYIGASPVRFFDADGRLLTSLSYTFGTNAPDTPENPLASLTSHPVSIWMQGVGPCSDVSVTYSFAHYPEDPNAEGLVWWSDHFDVKVAELANRATSDLMTEGPTSAQTVDSAGVPDSAKFEFTLAGLGSQNTQVSLKAPRDSGQGQSALLLNGGFNVYYAPDGTDQSSGPDPAAVRFDPGTDNGSGNILATVSTLKDQFSRVIEGAPESFYYDAFVYNALVPGASAVTAASASPSESDGAGDSDFLKNIAPADSEVLFPFTGDPTRDIQQQLGRAMLTNYQTLYGGYGQLLLQAFLEARDESNQLYHNALTVWRVRVFDSIVHKHVDPATHLESREIVIDDRLDPVKAAQELYSELSVQAGGGFSNMPAVGKTLGGIVGDYLASANGNDVQGALDVYFKELNARVQQVSATAAWLASSYYKSIALVGEGANIVVALNDLGNGDITALVNFVPFLGKAVSETGVFSKIRLFGEDLSSTLSAAKCKLLGQGCLLAGTLVQTQGGLKPIEDVTAGEKVWSFNRATGAWELEPVLATIQHPFVGDIVTLTAGVEDLSMTSNHPVWVVSGEGLADRPASAEVSSDEQAPTAEGRWVAAGDVRIGDLLLLHSGQTAAVTGTSLTPEYTVVYNLTVDQTHDFAIGDEGVLVHNAQACDARTAQAIEGIWMDLFQVREVDGVYVIGGRKATWGSKAFANGGVINLTLSDGRAISVPFTKGGFPDFSNFLYQGGKNTVKITLTNDRGLDEAAANALAGYAATPEGFTWHHSENLGVMQLVDRAVNNEVKHTGGFAILKAALQQLGKTFNLADASL